MTFRVETFCRHKGHKQGVEEMDDPMERGGMLSERHPPPALIH